MHMCVHMEVCVWGGNLHPTSRTLRENHVLSPGVGKKVTGSALRAWGPYLTQGDIAQMLQTQKKEFFISARISDPDTLTKGASAFQSMKWVDSMGIVFLLRLGDPAAWGLGCQLKA